MIAFVLLFINDLIFLGQMKPKGNGHKMLLNRKKRVSGNSVSHSQRKTKRVQKPNLITKRLYIPEEDRTVTVRLSARALRTLTKMGIQKFLKEEGIAL